MDKRVNKRAVCKQPCARCGTTKRPRQVHRIVPGAEGGEYVEGNVEPLCESCHDIEHGGDGTAPFIGAAREGGRKGAVATNALKDADGKSVNARKGGLKGGREGARTFWKRFDSEPNFAAQMSEARRKAGRKGGRKGMRAFWKRFDSEPNFAAQVSEAQRENGRKGGRKNGALYGRDDLVQYIREQDPGSRNRTSRSKELAAEIEREHGVRVNSCTIRKIWRGERYAYVK